MIQRIMKMRLRGILIALNYDISIENEALEVSLFK